MLLTLPNRAVVSTFDSLGATRRASLLRRTLRSRGLRVPAGPRRATRANRAGLTVRQMDVLRLLADGCSNAEIANRLNVSPRTADHHVSALLAKLGAASRRSAVAPARRMGVLTPEK